MIDLRPEGFGATLKLKTRLLGVGLALASAAVLTAPATAYEGFGAVTRGADNCPTGFTTYHVNSLDDSGPGTLRDAISQGCRYIVFDLGGTITLASNLKVRVSYLTIDGASAPSPGITINHPTINESVAIEPNSASGPVHDIIVHHLRHTGPGGHNDTASDMWGLDGSAHPVYNVILDHIRADGANDGIFDMYGNVHDVTVSWNFITGTVTAMAIAGGTGRKYNISVHHNVFAKNQERQPKLRGDTEADLVNNVVYGWGWQGCTARGLQPDSADAIDPKFNAEHNVFHHVTAGVSCVDGNGGIVFQNGVGSTQAYFNENIVPVTETDETTTGSRLPIPGYAEVTKHPASTLGNTVVRCVGTNYRTASEQALLDEIGVAIGGSGGPCPTGGSPPAPPTNLVAQ